MYDDDQALGAELRRLAEADPLGPIRADDLLARGRRGRRRRQALSATGVAALVGAVALTAATLPELDGDRGNAVAADRTAAGTAPTPSAETPSATKPTPTGPTSVRPTNATRAAPDAGSAEILRACSAKLSALKSQSGQKSGPSVPAATDLTGWTVLVRATQPRVGTAFVALSPDRKLNATCVIYAPGVLPGMDTASDTRAWPARLRPRKALSPYLFTVGTSCTGGLKCSGFLYTSLHSVPAKVARIRATATNGRFVDLRPRDGWLAVMWADGGSARFGLKYRAYDAQGKEIRQDADLYNDEVQRDKDEWAKKRQR